VAKGGGSANKTFLFQQTKALLNKEKLMKFIDEKVKTLGTGILNLIKIEIKFNCVFFKIILSCLVNFEFNF
jgi:hypothetical protein